MRMACLAAAMWLPSRRGLAEVSRELPVEQLETRIECVTFHSRALGRGMAFCVVLPSDFTRERTDWPVLYVLHGRGRTCRSLIDDDGARGHLLRAEFVIVLPQGDDGWYIDSPVRADERYAAYLAEVMTTARRQYGLSGNPRRQGICGWSMGGYGSVHYAVTHPGEFGVVASIVGLLDFPRDGLPEGQSYSVPVKRFGGDAAIWRRFNPLLQAHNLSGSSLLIISADQAFDRTMNENFRERLRELGVQHTWVLLPGGHTFDVVRAALPLVIDHAGRTFRGEMIRD
jgi:S-formylglutathione hydrolase FrmB